MNRRAQGRHDPVRLVDVELARTIPDIEPARPLLGGTYREVRVLARLHGRPLGSVTIPLAPDGLVAPGVVAGFVADAIWSELSEPIRDHCRQDGLPVPEKLAEDGLGEEQQAACSWRHRLGGAFPLVTVVITTCGGPDSGLSNTLRDVLVQTYPRFEVVVIDNRPATSGVRHALATGFPGETRLRYAPESRQGLSHARNRGAVLAHGEIVAFTDDDVRVDPDWLGWLVAGFEGPRVACVTGLILPLEIETPAQRLLEEFGGYAKGFTRRTWDADRNRPDNPLYPYTVGIFGSGANAAFRVSALAAVGGFDGALGAGTKGRGGEDLDIYVTCVQKGYEILYEPAALIRHAHLREMAQVHQKVRDYGVGLGAMLTKHLVRDWPTARNLLVRVPAGSVHLLSRRSAKNAAKSPDYPGSLVVAELEGLLYGPVAYARSRRAS